MAVSNNQFSAIGHGVAGVHRQVDDDLFELCRVGSYRPQSGWQHRHNLNILSDQAAHHLLRAFDDTVQVKHLGFQGLPAGKSQEPPHQRARPVACLENLVHIGPKLAFRPQNILGQLRVPGDDGQEIIEIVSYASRQAPHRLHLLRLAKFLFQLLVFGDVHHHAAELAYFAAIISHHADDILEPDRLAVRRYCPVSKL